VFVRLAATKVVTDKERPTSGPPKEADHPAGLWLADPSQWSASDKTEHPWDDPDEFFASVLKAWVMNPKMLDKSIAKFTKADPAVKKPAADLLALLSGLPESKTPKTPLSKESAEAANKELAALSDPRNVEDTLDSTLNDLLRWTLKPDKLGKGSIEWKLHCPVVTVQDIRSCLLRSAHGDRELNR